MFWKYNTTSLSQFETILSQQDVTLQEIMDKEDVLNECKAQNRFLIEFLIKPEILQELVTLTITEPPSDVDEDSRFKYAYIACEMITCDIPSLNERLAGDKTLLAKLYDFLDKDPPLNPLLASFFSKIMAVLIAKQTDQNWLSNQFTCLQVLDFLKAKENFVPLLLNHLGTSAIMDLTLKLMTQVKGAEVTPNIMNYLDSQRVIQNLVALLDPHVDSNRHHNVAQLLCDFIREDRSDSGERNDPDPLLNALESPETVALLLDHIFGEEKSESGIVAGIEILLTLLKSNETKPEAVALIMNEIVKRLKDIHRLLIDPPKKSPIVTTVGTLDPPLGNTRLHVAKLLAAVIAMGGDDMVQELISLGTMAVLLDLFFAFPWNNFLHTNVQACICAALDKASPSELGDNVALSKHLLIDCKLVERILDAWKENEEKSKRQGYMGHLINIANHVVQLCTDNSPLGNVLRECSPELFDALKVFNEGSLTERNKVHEALLGGVNPHDIKDENDDFRDFPTEGSGTSQQIFENFQNRQRTQNAFESFGYNDDEFEFKDGEEIFRTIENRAGMNFDMLEGDLAHQQELFKQVCAQTINTMEDDDEQIFEGKDRPPQTATERDNEVAEHQWNASGSDDEDDPIMEAEFWSPPVEANEAPPLIMSDDPWGAKSPNGQSNNSGWADFSTVPFVAKFDDHVFNNFTAEPDLKVENIEIDAKEESCTVVQQQSTNEISQGPLKEEKEPLQKTMDDGASSPPQLIEPKTQPESIHEDKKEAESQITETKTNQGGKESEDVKAVEEVKTNEGVKAKQCVVEMNDEDTSAKDKEVA